MITHRIAVPLAGILAGTSVLFVQPAVASPPAVEKKPVAEGYGGAVSTVDPDASRVGAGGAAPGRQRGRRRVAAAATLGVTEPTRPGIGGGGFFVYYDAAARGPHDRRPRDRAAGDAVRFVT